MVLFFCVWFFFVGFFFLTFLFFFFYIRFRHKKHVHSVLHLIFVCEILLVCCLNRRIHCIAYRIPNVANTQYFSFEIYKYFFFICACASNAIYQFFLLLLLVFSTCVTNESACESTNTIIRTILSSY